MHTCKHTYTFTHDIALQHFLLTYYLTKRHNDLNSGITTHTHTHTHKKNTNAHTKTGRTQRQLQQSNTATCDSHTATPPTQPSTTATTTSAPLPNTCDCARRICNCHRMGYGELHSLCLWLCIWLRL